MTRSLGAIELDIAALPLGARDFRERLAALQAEWSAANLALFDAQVAADREQAHARVAATDPELAGKLFPLEALPDTDPAGILARLGAKVSPDLDAYAAGEIDASQVHCVLCTYAPCRCPEFGTPEYMTLMDRLHGRPGV